MTAEKKPAATKKKDGKEAASPRKEKKATEAVVKKAVKQAAKEVKKAPPHEEKKEESVEKKPVELEETAAKKPAKKKAAAEKAKPEEPKEAKKKKERKKKPVSKIEHIEPKTLTAEDKKKLAKRKKKPRFMRQELYKLPRLKDVWRKSRGIDSKKHEGKRGKGSTPNEGYKNPADIRGLHAKGYYPVLVRNTADLEKINPAKDAAVIAGNIGRRSRNEMIASANKLKITILNPRKGELK